MLNKFCNVYVVKDRKYKVKKLLPEEKMSPVDAGKEVWDILYSERVKI